MFTKTRRTLLHSALALAIAPAALAQTAQAEENYPTRPVTFVVGYAAGGATDILARIMAKEISQELDQTVVVENKAGANSNIGAEYVARAPKDGYTLFVGSIANTINRALYDDLRYDTLKDFERVGMMATIPNVLVVNPDMPINSVDEYIKYAKDKPGELNCASSGIGSSIHMSCELFKIQADTDILHVPYRGSGPAVSDLLGGQVDSMFDNLPSALPHIQAGTLRPIATTTAERTEALPDTPTFSENGMTDFLVQSWFALDAPAGTPESVIKRLNEALNRALQSEEVQEIYRNNGFTLPPQPNTPQAHAEYVQQEIDKWDLVVKEADLSAN